MARLMLPPTPSPHCAMAGLDPDTHIHVYCIYVHYIYIYIDMYACNMTQSWSAPSMMRFVRKDLGLGPWPVPYFHSAQHNELGFLFSA